MTDDPEFRRRRDAMNEATAQKSAVWERIGRDPHDDALWDEYDAWRREEDRLHQELRDYLRSRKRG